MKKRGMSNLSMLAILIAIIALLLPSIGGFNKTSRTKFTYEKAMIHDLDNNYPSSCAQVMEVNNSIVGAIYSGTSTDKEISELVAKERKLFSKELLELNPIDNQIENIIVEVNRLNKNANSIIEFSIGNTDFVESDVTYGKVIVSQYTNVRTINNVEYTLIKEDDKWKIISFKLLETRPAIITDN